MVARRRVEMAESNACAPFPWSSKILTVTASRVCFCSGSMVMMVNMDLLRGIPGKVLNRHLLVESGSKVDVGGD